MGTARQAILARLQQETTMILRVREATSMMVRAPETFTAIAPAAVAHAWSTVFLPTIQPHLSPRRFQFHRAVQQTGSLHTLRVALLLVRLLSQPRRLGRQHLPPCLT